MGVCVVANWGTLSLFADPHAFERHLHLVSWAYLETILRTEVFVNESDHQVKAAHKILGYDPIQRSFAAPKSVIKAKDPRLQKITVAEHDFFFLGESFVQQVAEIEEERGEVQEQVIKLDQSEDEFAHLNNWICLRILLVTQAIVICLRRISKGLPRRPTWVSRGNRPRAFMIYSRAHRGKICQGNHSRNFPLLPPPPSKPEHPQTRSPSAQPPPAKLPPTVQPADPKRKRSTKGKEPMDGGRSRASYEEDEGRRASKQLRVASQGPEKEVDV